MSFLSKLNPLPWVFGKVKNLVISDYVGSAHRHGLTSFGAFLVSSGMSSAPIASTWAEATWNLVSQPEFIAGVTAIVTGAVASVANKQVP